MAKAKTINDALLVIACPACDGQLHGMRILPPFEPNRQWVFDGNFEKPTLTPSVNIRTGKYVDPKFEDSGGVESKICHFFITNGQISYCSDSTHDKAGMTLDLPEID